MTEIKNEEMVHPRHSEVEDRFQGIPCQLIGNYKVGYLSLTSNEVQLALIHVTREIIRLSAESNSRLTIETANRMDTLSQLHEDLINM